MTINNHFHIPVQIKKIKNNSKYRKMLITIFQTELTWMACFDCWRSSKLSASYSESSWRSIVSLDSICTIKSRSRLWHSWEPVWLGLQKNDNKKTATSARLVSNFGWLAAWLGLNRTFDIKKSLPLKYRVITSVLACSNLASRAKNTITLSYHAQIPKFFSIINK